MICSLHFTFVLQQETKQVLSCTGKSVATRPRKEIPLPTHPAFPRWCLQHCLCVWAHSDLLQQFHLMDKKRPRQAGWFSLKRRKQIGKILLESSSTYLQHAEEAELGSPQRQGTNAAAWEILLMLLRSFHLVWWEWILLRKGTELLVVKSLLSKILKPRCSRETLLLSPYILTFTYTLAHTSDTKWIPPC